jgi:hypothetical protein
MYSLLNIINSVSAAFYCLYMSHALLLFMALRGRYNIDIPVFFPLGNLFLNFIYLFAVLGFELRVYTLSHSTSPFFVMDFFFSDRVSRTVCPRWLQTTIFLISAS